MLALMDLILIRYFGKVSRHLLLQLIIILQNLVLNDSLHLGQAVLLHLPFHERHLHLLVRHLLHQLFIRFVDHVRVVLTYCLQLYFIEPLLDRAHELSHVLQKLFGSVVGENTDDIFACVAIDLVLHLVDLLACALLNVIRLLLGAIGEFRFVGQLRVLSVELSLLAHLMHYL